jgi:hypothetical protein
MPSHGNSGYANAPQFYFIRLLPVPFLVALDGHVDKLSLYASDPVQLRFEVQNRKLLTIQTASVNFWWEIGVETFRCELMDVAEPQYSG